MLTAEDSVLRLGKGARKGCVNGAMDYSGRISLKACASTDQHGSCRFLLTGPFFFVCFQCSYRHCGPWTMIPESGEQCAEDTDQSRRAQSQVGIPGDFAIGRLCLNHRLKVEEKLLMLYSAPGI